MSAPTASEAIEGMRDMLGIAEHPDGSNRTSIGEEYGWNGQPWCAETIWVGFHRLGATDLLHVKTAACVTLARAFRAAGQWGSKPRRGALVFYIWAGDSIEHHVEMVEAVNSDGSIIAIGGNVGNKVSRTRRRAHIAGYGYPAYAPEKPSQPTPAIRRRVVRKDEHLRSGKAGRVTKTIARRGGEVVVEVCSDGWARIHWASGKSRRRGWVHSDNLRSPN